MANFTRRELKNAFIELINERPLNDITVKDIVDRCGVSRNCFYYNFQDMPDLINDIIEGEANKIIEAHSKVGEMVDCFDAVVDFARDKKRAIMHIYHSVSRDAFDRTLMAVCEKFLQRYISEILPRIEQTQTARLVSYYKCFCFGLITDWLNNGMSAEYAKTIRGMFVLKKDAVEEMANLLGEWC